jgi:hypothetical protein
MPDEVENHILKKFEIKKRLGKGVCRLFFIIQFNLIYLQPKTKRHMGSYGRQ